MKSTPLLGFIAGIAAGSVLGILFAPEKGSRTRQKLKDSVTDLTSGIADKFRKELGDEFIGAKSTIMHINKNIVERV